jgi:hypothetical protein
MLLTTNQNKRNGPHQKLRITSMTEVQRLEKVEVHPGFLRAYFLKKEEQEPFYSDYHWFWLRHNCSCRPHCCHEQTGERLLDSSELRLDSQPLSAEITPTTGDLHVSWGPSLLGEDQTARHESTYTPSFLISNAYSINRKDIPPPPGDLSKVEIDYNTFTSETHAQYLREMGARLNQFGVVVIRNRGMDTEAIM